MRKKPEKKNPVEEEGEEEKEETLICLIQEKWMNNLVNSVLISFILVVEFMYKSIQSF